MDGLRDLYRIRFDELERRRKDALWAILCRYLQRYLPPSPAVVDLGAGHCEFINHVSASRRIAVDLNPDARAHAAPGVEFHQAACDSMPFLPDGSVDAVFMSNFLEHLAGKDQVLAVFREAHRALRPGGRILVIQPNIRLAYREYWDFFDHHVALSDRSLVEGLGLAGFRPVRVVPAFLPYTTKSAVPKWPSLLRLYLALPFLWRLFGKQALVVAEKTAVGEKATIAGEAPAGEAPGGTEETPGGNGPGSARGRGG